MKHTLINYTLIIASALCLSGCEEHTDSASTQPNRSASTQPNRKVFKNSFDVCIYSLEIEGHEYIIIDGHNKGGIIHSESCPCKQEKSK